MTRTLMTAANLYCDHPNLRQIKFIVLPILREKVNVSSDVSGDIYDVVERFKPGSPDAKGLVFDFSACFTFSEPQLWQLHSLCNSSKQMEIMMKMFQRRNDTSCSLLEAYQETMITLGAEARN